MHMHEHAYRCLRDPVRPDSPPGGRSAAPRREAGERHRGPGRDPPVRRLAPSADPARGGLCREAAGWAAAPLPFAGSAVPRARRLARAVSRPVGSASRPLRGRAREAAESPWHHAQGETHMSRNSSAAAASAMRPKVVIERTYRARVEELWDLWTTKEGFESWWGPEGFRVEVHALEARVGGTLHYDMIADAPEQVAAMRRMGRPTSHRTRASFVELRPHARLAIAHVIDFLPGVKP